MQDCIGAASQRHDCRDAILKGFWGHDVQWFDVTLQQLQQGSAAQVDEVGGETIETALLFLQRAPAVVGPLLAGAAGGRNQCTALFGARKRHDWCNAVLFLKDLGVMMFPGLKSQRRPTRLILGLFCTQCCKAQH